MDLIWLKIIYLVVLFVVIFLCALAPLWISRRQSKRPPSANWQLAAALCNCFGGGIFLSVCFVGLLPPIREKFGEAFKEWRVPDYPATECTVLLGYFLILLVEKLGQRCQTAVKKGKDPAPEKSVELQDEVEDKEDAKLIEACTAVPLENGISHKCNNHVNYEGNNHSHNHHANNSHHHQDGHNHSHHHHDDHEDEEGHGHSHQMDVNGLSFFKSMVLLIALGLHSVFEGIAMGLQVDTALLTNLFVSVLLHEMLCAVAMGMSLCGNKDESNKPRTVLIVNLCLIFSLTIPVGMVLGMVLISVFKGAGGSFANGTLQGIATGTLFHVVFSEILPEALSGKRWPLLKILCAFIGCVIMSCIVIATDRY